MKASTMALASALVGSMAMSAVAVAQGPAPKPEFKFEKCYGVVKAGKNDCQTTTHSCAGTAKQGCGARFLGLRPDRHLRQARRRQPGTEEVVIALVRPGATIVAFSHVSRDPRCTGMGFRAAHFAEIVAVRPSAGSKSMPRCQPTIGAGPAEAKTLRGPAGHS